MSEPQRAIVYDHDRAILVELPRTLTVQYEGRTRELFLRVARGVIRDVEVPERPLLARYTTEERIADCIVTGGEMVEQELRATLKTGEEWP